jgi:hypothetical protein
MSIEYRIPSNSSFESIDGDPLHQIDLSHQEAAINYIKLLFVIKGQPSITSNGSFEWVGNDQLHQINLFNQWTTINCIKVIFLIMRQRSIIGLSKSLHPHDNTIQPWSHTILPELRGHTYSPLRAVTLRKRSVQARMVASHSSGQMKLRISCALSCHSSNERPSKVCRHCFTVSKR